MLSANELPEAALSGVWFISDMHLSPERPDISDALWRFLSDLRQHNLRCVDQTHRIERLYLLGDLFETWIGDDGADHTAMTLCDHLAKLTACGVTVSLQHGNRDFLIGAPFVDRFGGVLLPEQHVINLFEHRVLLLHGDELCTKDSDYQALRKQFRSSAWQAAFLSQSLTERQAQATHYRQASQAAQKDKQAAILDVSPSAVEQTFAQHAIQTLIHGHTHRPALHRYPTDGAHAPRCRAVLGDWGKQIWALRATAIGLDLLTWDGDAHVHQARLADQQPWPLDVSQHTQSASISAR